MLRVQNRTLQFLGEVLRSDDALLGFLGKIDRGSSLLSCALGLGGELAEASEIEPNVGLVVGVHYDSDQGALHHHWAYDFGNEAGDFRRVGCAAFGSHREFDMGAWQVRELVGTSSSGPASVTDSTIA